VVTGSMLNDDQFEDRYREALLEYIDRPEDENSLLAALDLGRLAIAEGRSLLDVPTVHNMILLSNFATAATALEALSLFERAHAFLAQAVAPFEMTHRGWASTAARLTELNATLEQRVESQKLSLQAAEAQLRRTEAQLVRAHKVGGIGMAGTNLTTLKVTWSEGLYELLDLDPATVEPTADSFVAAIHPDDRAMMKDIIRRARDAEEIEACEFRVIRQDGSQRWLFRRSELDRDDDGKPLQFVSTIFDITERKNNERALQLSNERLARVQQIAGIGSTETDLITGEVTWSDEFHALIGIDRSAIGTDFASFSPFIHPEDRELVRDWDIKGWRGQQVPPGEFRFMGPDGKYRWLYRQADFARDTDGRPIHLIATLYEITDRKRAERELLRSSQRLARTQRIARIGSMEIDLVTGETVWSEEIYYQLGLDPKVVEPEFEAFLEVAHSDDLVRLRDAHGRGRNGEDVEPFEYRAWGPDGTIRWFYRQADFIRDANGRSVIFIATIYDITDRKMAEAASRRVREHLARAQQVGHIGSTEIDFVTGTVFWSDEIFRMLGVDAATTVPSVAEFATRVHPSDRDGLNAISGRAFRGESITPFEFRIVRPNGTIRWLNRVSEVSQDMAGAPTSQVATMYDVTDLKRVEDELRQQRDTAQNYLDVADVMILALNLDGTVAMINRRGCEILEYDDPADIVGKSWIDDFIVEPMREATRESFQRLLSGMDADWNSKENSIQTRTGVERMMRWQSKVILDGRGNAVATLNSGDDITERTKTEEQLRQSQKMEAVGRLTGGVAHDFNNLLTVVLGNLELVREKVEGDAKMMRQIDSALGAGRRGADLTHRLLAFSRMQPLEPISVDIDKRISDLVPLLSRTIGETIEIRQKHTKSSLWKVVVDPGQFESSIMNLAVNARDAMPGGGILVIDSENLVVDRDYASRHPGLITGNYVRISVGDTGIGMAPDIIEQAFEPFFTTKEVGKGTGLGLSMIYGFVKQSGGYATIYSEVGVGTTVTILLPADADDRAGIVAPSVIAAAKIGTETILVVEDDPEVRDITISFLDAMGYTTLQAGSVREGYEIFAATADIAMILTDVILPGGEDGADFARRARALRPDIKVLFMSGYTEDIVMHHGRLDAGVVLLRKPFTRAQLSEKIRVVIDGALPALIE